MTPSPIVFGIDRRYVEPLIVTLASLALDGGVTSSNASIHVLHCSLERTDQARLASAAEAFALDVQLVEVDPDPHAYPVTDWITAACYLRLRMGEVLPDHDRALYLDCDLISVGEIGELLALTPTAPVAAVRDLSHPQVGSGNGLPGYAELGLPGDREYFNSGVLVVNLELWRSERIASQATRFLVEKPQHVRFRDQDALNVVLDDGWERLPAEYNAVVMSHLMPMLEEHYLGEEVLPLADALEVETTARILHFAGPFKPWNAPAYPDCDAGRTYARYQSAARDALG